MNKAAPRIKQGTVATDSSKVCSRASQSQPGIPFASVNGVEADGVRVFDRAAGNTTAPVVLILHYFPASSFMFRELIARLAHRRMQIASKNEIAAEAQSGDRSWIDSAISAVTKHWPEYLIEAACLGLFMVSACSFTVLLEHPASAIRRMLPNAFVRRLLAGLAMGTTAIALIYSPWGKQSGAHLNPSVTLTFFRLGKIEPWDACFYVVAQFIGGILGVLFSSLIWGHAIAEQNVRYAATLPGPRGTGVAFVAEMVISFVMMTMILNVSNSAHIARFTGVIAGALVATYITLESPLSGMSMSPARSLASAAPGGFWNSLWIYFTAPPLGMMLAAQVYVWLRGKDAVFCAKLHHDNHKRCIFRCHYQTLLTAITLKETM